MRNPQIVCAQVLRLKERGFMIAIDDFGSGYSSLGQLQQLMADVLKLDRSFVRRGMFGTRERIVIGNVIHMAGELGMQVICEGVENAKQAEMLIELGCYYAQGFYYRETCLRGFWRKAKFCRTKKKTRGEPGNGSLKPCEGRSDFLCGFKKTLCNGIKGHVREPFPYMAFYTVMGAEQ